MKAGECIKDDLVSYNGDRHKIIEVTGDSVRMLNIKTQNETVISRYHSVIMVERKRQDTPPGHEWRVYVVSKENSMSRRTLKKGLTYEQATAFANAMIVNDDEKIVIHDGRAKKSQAI